MLAGVSGVGYTRGSNVEIQSMDNSTPESNSRFAEISSQVIELMSKTRSILFGLQANEVPAAIHAGHALSNRLYQEEKKAAASVLTGIASIEYKLHCTREAQLFNRLSRIVHQMEVLCHNVQEIAGDAIQDDVEAFKPVFLMAEVELRDAVLSVLRGDEQLAFGVVKQDEELDSLYAAEMRSIFTKASQAMFYDFRVGTSLLFILRAIERIGDHAKQLAVPSFHALTAKN